VNVAVLKLYRPICLSNKLTSDARVIVKFILSSLRDTGTYKLSMLRFARRLPCLVSIHSGLTKATQAIYFVTTMAYNRATGNYLHSAESLPNRRGFSDTGNESLITISIQKICKVLFRSTARHFYQRHSSNYFKCHINDLFMRITCGKM